MPIDAKRHQVTWHLLAHPDQLASFTPELVEQEMAMLVDVHLEDMVTCRSVQEGLERGLIDRFRLTALESTIADFHRWIRAMMSAPAARAGERGDARIGT